MVYTESSSKSSVSHIFHSKLGQLPVFKLCLALAVLVLVGCQGQTFQYSRGWTNGKRSGYSVGPSGALTPPQSSFDTDAVPEDQSISPSLTMNLRNGGGSHGRLRSADSAQYLSKKLSSAGNIGGNRKPPVWMILGAEQEPSNAEF